MSDYTDGAVDLLDALGIDAEAAVVGLMHKLKSLQGLTSGELVRLNSQVTKLTEALAQKDADIEVIKDKHREHLDEIDDVVSEGGLKVECKCCGKLYTIDYGISSFRREDSYYGASERCTP